MAGINHIKCPVVILAGGRATRMGGVDKMLLPLGSMRVIDHILFGLRPQSGAVAINANGDPLRFAGLGVPILPDLLPGFPGPLAGVLAAMEWAAGQRYDFVVTVAGDTPFFPDTLVADLMLHAQKGRPCLASLRDPTGGLLPQPTFGLWPVDLRSQLRADLALGQRKMQLWARAQNATFAPFEGDGRAFFNINTPQDLEAAAQFLTPVAAGPDAI